jgi:hypothetical protein
LQAELDEVGQRLREMIAQALGRTIAQAVTESVQLALSGESLLPSPPPCRPAILPGRSSSLWQEPAQPGWRHDEDDRYGYDVEAFRDDDEDAFRDEESLQTNAHENQEAAWSRSLAACLEIAAWYLRLQQPPSRRQRPDPPAPLAGGTLLGGEVIVLSARLALALLHLLLLADTCQTGEGVFYRAAHP